jgi:hypothetical protein
VEAVPAQERRRRRSNTESTEVCITEDTEGVFLSVFSVGKRGVALRVLRVIILVLLACAIFAPALFS